MKLRRDSVAMVAAAAFAFTLAACGGGGTTSPHLANGTAPGSGSGGGSDGGNGGGGGGGGGNSQGETRKMTVVVLAIDSLMPEDIDATAMPNVSSLITNGTLYTESRSVFSAETIPNHVAMVTGVYPDRNGIPTNNFIDREALAAGVISEIGDEDLDNPNEIEAKTIFTWIDEKCRSGAIPRNADIKTAAVLSKLYLHAVFEGDDADPQDNDVGIDNIIPDFHFKPQGEPEGSRPGYIGPGSEHAVDNTTGPAAVAALADADFIFINLGDVDRSSHASGQSGRQASRTTADAQVGDLVAALVDAGRWDDTVFIISSDHGMDFSIADDPNNTAAGGEDLFTDPPFDPAQFASGAGNAALNSLSTQSTILDPLAGAACGFEPMFAVQNGGTNSILVPNADATLADKAAALHAARSCLLNFDDNAESTTATCTDAISAGMQGASDVEIAACKTSLFKPVNVEQIQHAWFANPIFYSGNNLISALGDSEAESIMPATIKSRHENLGDLVLVIGDGYKFSEPDASGNPIPGNHGHMPTIHNTIIVSGGSAILETGNTVNGTSDDHFVRDPVQSENIDVAATVAWLLGLSIQDSDFPDAGQTFPDYGDNVSRSGFDGRVLTEAFNIDPLVSTPSECGIIN